MAEGLKKRLLLRPRSQKFGNAKHPTKKKKRNLPTTRMIKWGLPFR